MKVKRHHLSLSLFLILIIGCSSESDDKKQTTEKFDPDAQSSINGIITLDSNLAVDSDLNDTTSPYTDNSTFSLAQELPNVVRLQGFASKVETRLFEQEQENKRKNDRFYASSDEYDFFKVELFEGQTIQLQSINSNSLETDETFSGDLDLFLYDLNYAIVAQSDNLSEFDYITVPVIEPDDSDSSEPRPPVAAPYYISVHANSGASKYLLTLNPAPNITQSRETSSKRPALDFVPNELIVQFSDQPTTAAANPVFASMRTTNTGRSKPTLARFSDTYASAATSSRQAEALKELASLNPASYEKLLTLHKRKALQASPHIKSASLNYRRYALAVPSDPLYSQQWHYPAINLPEAWDITTGTPETGDVIVAVIDTGIFASHPDLANKLVSGYDFVSDPFSASDNDPGTTNPYSDIDDNPEDVGYGWHGTHVAGTIGAETNNDYGVAGVSWGAKIMPVRALGIDGGTTYDIMEALRFSAGLENDSGTVPTRAADIINLSFAGGDPSSEEQALLSQIYDLGIIVIAAAGNESTSLPQYPASYNRVISVSALDASNQLASYSNYGTAIDIAAPGGDVTQDSNEDDEIDGILSTLVNDSTEIAIADFDYYEGTSMAAPHVSGMFALMKAVYPELDAGIADTLLKNNLLTTDIGGTGKDTLYGHGAADALKAVQAAQALSNGTPLSALPISMLSTPSYLSFNSFNADTSTTLEASITILNEGETSAIVSSTNIDGPWISLDYLSNQENQLGNYTITVDSSDLDTGFYQGSVTFNISNAITNEADLPLVVPIYLEILDVANVSQTAAINIYLYDQTTHELVRQSSAFIDPDTIDGQLRFSIDRIKGGSYYLYAGSDIDNDSRICQPGEACATYPNINARQALIVADDASLEIELTAQLLSSTYVDDIINNQEEEDDDSEPDEENVSNPDTLRQSRE